MNVSGVSSTLSSMYYDSGKIQKMLKQKNCFTGNLQRSEETKTKEDRETREMKKTEREETDSDIIVMPDGSRVLVITMNMGGMQTSMSLEISKPTELVNDVSRTEDYIDTIGGFTK
ncbi:MAG: hypothetical protein NC293_11495 [Roseburia sp.]|nr:hypothetical protein [Roseburia sp.]